MTGAALAAALVYVHLRAQLDPGYESFCRAAESLDCESVITSRFGTALGVPLAVWGLAGYAAMAIVSATNLLLPLAGFATLVSVALAAISVTSLGRICPLCAATWVVNGALLVTAWRGRAKVEPPSLRRTMAAGAVGVVIVAGGGVMTPRSAALNAWRAGLALPHGTDEQGHPRLGARDARLVVEEFLDYSCPHCPASHAKLRAALDGADGVRMVRHDWARMSCRPIPTPERSRSCLYARAAFCAGRQDRFWEMNDYLLAHQNPRLDPTAAARAVGLDAGAFRKCFVSQHAFEAGAREEAHARTARISGTPSYVINGQRKRLDEVLDAIRAAP